MKDGREQGNNIFFPILKSLNSILDLITNKLYRIVIQKLSDKRLFAIFKNIQDFQLFYSDM